MAVFPFTVRATDSEGSFADRQFNITVRNSKVERYLLLNNGDAYTSSDGLAWTVRPGQGGSTATYGNGMWMIIGTPGVRKSFDGVNWTFVAKDSMIFNSTLPAGVDTGYRLPNLASIGKVRFLNGKFWFVYYYNGTRVFSSTDGVTWNYTALSNSTSTNPYSNLLEMREDAGTLFCPNANSSDSTTTYGQYNASGIKVLGWQSVDAGVTWTPVRNTALAASVAQCAPVLARFNGLYIAHGLPNVTPMYMSSSFNYSIYFYSTDGANWTQGTFGSTFSNTYSPVTMVYANGTLMAMTNKNNANAYSGHLYATSTDGINWNAVTSPTMVQDVPNTTNNGILAYKNGVFLWAPDSAYLGTTAGNLSQPGARISFNGTTWAVTNQYSGTTGTTNFNDAAIM